VRKGRIVVSTNGPYLVSGSLPLREEISVVGEDGEPEKWVKGRKYPLRADYTLCRCGHSKTKPFCDRTHARVRFDGTEKASRKPYAGLSERIEGPELILRDAETLCSSARFCLAKGGTWRLTLRSRDPVKRKLAIEQACNCPSGRLVAYDKETGEPIEPEFTPSISLTEDPQAGTSGPIWVKGGIPIESADGPVYEVRNRVTLCRCGKSKNKPFCDGSHIKAEFNDGDESLRE
jgi:CDGSH-type Zn-finger protein